MSTKYKTFKTLLSDLDLDAKYSSLLADNGFDEWASVCELNHQILQDLGVECEIERGEIVACVKAAMDQPQILQSEIVEEDGPNDQQLQEIGNESGYQSGEEEHSYLNILDETVGHQLKNKIEPKPEIKISIKIIEKASFRAKMRKESEKQFYTNTLTLFLASRGYSKIVRVN